MRLVLGRLPLVIGLIAMLAGCESTVVGGGGLGGGGAGGGEATGGEEATSTGDGTTATSGTASSSTTSGATASSTGSGTPTAAEAGVVVPGEDDDVHVLLGNFAHTCDAPQDEPPCAPGDWWLATIQLPTSHLTPGRYPLNTGEVSIGLHETYDDCSGEGFAGWDGEPAWLTVDAVDAAHLVLTIEDAYASVDGTWDVPLCSGVTPP